jgi:sigma-B regulation protein RsbU (phosphoserine phosphatase)
MMAMTRSLFRSCSTCRKEPDQMLSFINENLCRVNKENFVTAIYAVYDARRRSLTIARTGHPHPMHYRASQKAAMEVSCDGVFAMGWDPYAQVPVTEIRLEPGDRLLFYTDGVTERSNEEHELYGTTRLMRQPEAVDSDDPAKILDKIVEDLSQFSGDRPADDDQAVILLVTAQQLMLWRHDPLASDPGMA